MAILRNSAEGGTDGDFFTNSSATGGASGDAFSTVNLGTGSTAEFDSVAAHGSVGYLLKPASAQAAQVFWTFTAVADAHATMAFRTPSTVTTSVNIMSLRHASGPAAQIQYKITTGRLEVHDIDGAIIAADAATALSPNTWYRLELHCIPDTASTGTLEFAVYTLNSTTPMWSISVTDANCGTTGITSARFGRIIGAAETTQFWIDDLQLFTGADVPATMSNPWPADPLDKIPITVIAASSTSVSVGWTHPGDAPDGINIVRCDGAQVNDGNGLTPGAPTYDPLTIVGATTIATGLFSGDQPYLDTGLDPITYTYWVVRA